MAKTDPADCVRQLSDALPTLASADELTQHRLVNQLVACEEQAPVALAAAGLGLDDLIAESAIARKKLTSQWERLGPVVGGALLRDNHPAAVEGLVAAQRWYVGAGHERYGDVAGHRAFVETAAQALTRAIDNARQQIAELEGGEARADALFAAESLFKLVSRESGAAFVPPPETPAQARIREVCLVTLRELRDMLAAGGTS